jgi:N-acetyl sugar amidotransferase
MNKEYQRCTFCIMDTSDPEIVFDEQGICNHCKRQQHLQKTIGYREGISEVELNSIIEIIKHKQKNKQYDVVVGVSGGVDSAYALHYSVKLGLRVLAVHVDAGWNTEVAVNNIKKLCSSLDVDLHTVVIDWAQMRELQRAIILSGISNLDIPQDHVFVAGLYEMAFKYRVRFIINGSNFATEGIFPSSWEQNEMDAVLIKDINKKYSRTKQINKLPIMSIYKYLFYNLYFSKIYLLNHLPYSKSEAVALLQKLYDWEYYGGKHFESRFTRFFQSSYTIERFNYDKRIAHLSSLIVNGEITRHSAIEEIGKPPYENSLMISDLEYLLKKIDLSLDEYNHIIQSPKNFNKLKNSSDVLEFLLKVRNRIKGIV